MSFDGVFTHLMVAELNKKLVHGRVSKIQQPYDNEIVLTIRAQRQKNKLLLSAHPNYARIQLTEMEYDNPQTPPNFVMMLRKHLEGAILQKIEQKENDRVIHFSFSRRDELGDLQNLILIVELMGRHSTILLMNQTTGKILDAIKHIGLSQNTYRTILPGADYIAPPKQEKIDPFTASEKLVFEKLSTVSELSAKNLQNTFQGFGFDTAVELAFRLKQSPNEKLKVWSSFFAELNEHLLPTLVVNQTKEFFSPILFHSYITDRSEVEYYASLSELLDGFYLEKAERDRVKQQGNDLIHKVKNELKRNKTKLKKHQKTQADSENAEIFRQKGELLTTFMHQVPHGIEKISLPNYYDEDKPLAIQLDPAKTPNQNAQKYFQRYQKLRNAAKVVGQQIQTTKAEINYLESLLDQLELASPLDLKVIREELLAQGYIKERSKHKKKEKKSKAEEFLATDGTTILVGKNNLQNDQLTLKTAKKTDYWLHAQKIPGSHVIIRNSQPSQQTIIEAAELAAYFSKYRFSAKVPIDCVPVKYVKKPNGAKPGFVIYENQKTYFVTPIKAEIEKRRKHATN